MQLVYDIIHTAKGSSLNSIFGQSDTCTPLAHGQYEASQRQIRYISRASSETIRPGGGEIVLVGGKSKSPKTLAIRYPIRLYARALVQISKYMVVSVSWKTQLKPSMLNYECKRSKVPIYVVTHERFTMVMVLHVGKRKIACQA